MKHPFRAPRLQTFLLSPWRFLTIAALTCAAASVAQAQTNPGAQALPYTQDFGTTTFTTPPAGIAVWSGLNGGSITSLALAETSAPTNTATLTAATGPQTTGGAYGFATGGNAQLYIQTSGNATSGVNQPVLAVDTTAKTNITLGYTIDVISASASRTIGVVAQYRVGTNGGWTSLAPSSGSNPFSQAGGTTGLKTTVTAALPAPANNQPVVQIRWALWRGTEGGNSSGIGLDNISVAAAASTNAPTITGFTPAGGAFGSSVTITGANFSTASGVAFNGATAAFTIDGPTQITATVPGSATTGLISVTNPDGTGFSPTAFVVPTVTVTLPSTILEGNVATGVVTIPEALGINLPVTLTSSSTNDLTVETPIEIFAGDTSYTFNISAPANSSSSTNTVVTVTPASAGYAAAPGTTTVINTDAVKIPLTTLTTNSYIQDFNTLTTNTWTNAISPAVGTQASLGGAVNTNLNGWFATFLGGTPNTNLVADDGNGTNAAVYNYGNTGGADRSLGGLANNSTAPAYGALISNSTASTLNSVVINLTGKFWRSSSSVQNFLSFAYGEVDGTVVNNINFLTATNTNNVFRLPAANIFGPSPVPTNAVGPLDGNNITNQVQISNVAIPVDLAPGETMFIRWQDFDNSGFDAGLAIDDVSLTASTALAGPVLDTAVLDNLTLLQDAATVFSSVLTDAGSALTSRGFVFSVTQLNSNPVIGGPSVTVVTNAPPDVSAFTNTLTGLLASTSYTVKSFAATAAGTNYSPAISFNTLAPSPGFTGVYTQSFNGLTNTILPSGWRALTTGGIDSYAGDWNTAGSSGGFYGRTNIPGVLGYRFNASSGILTNRLTLINNTGGTLTNLWVSYMGEVNGPMTNTRFPAWTVVVDGQTNASLAYSTGAGSNEFKSAEITGLNIANGGTIAIGWWSDRGAGSGSSRLIGMTSVRVATNALATPTIGIAGSLTNFSTTLSNASPSQSFNASGTDLVANIAVTAPTDYEVSTNNTTFSPSVVLPQSGGAVSSTPVYVRIAATAPVGNPAGQVSLTSAGAATQNIAVTGTVSSGGSGFTTWVAGGPTNSANVLKYAIGGASSPTATDGIASITTLTTNALSITAIVRTNDPNLAVFGESLTNLSVPPWLTNGVTQTNAGDQSGVPSGTARQIFSVPRTNTNQFLRLDAILQP
jgi:hypothetical protein